MRLIRECKEEDEYIRKMMESFYISKGKECGWIAAVLFLVVSCDAKIW